MVSSFIFFFFFNDTATTEIYTLSLHDALPISKRPSSQMRSANFEYTISGRSLARRFLISQPMSRSEEHTSELQSRLHLVCRLLLEKKKNTEPRRMSTHLCVHPPLLRAPPPCSS